MIRSVRLIQRRKLRVGIVAIDRVERIVGIDFVDRIKGVVRVDAIDGIRGVARIDAVDWVDGFLGSTELIEFSGLLDAECHVVNTEAARDAAGTERQEGSIIASA
jgi:hypothetical protein